MGIIMRACNCVNGFYNSYFRQQGEREKTLACEYFYVHKHSRTMVSYFKRLTRVAFWRLQALCVYGALIRHVYITPRPYI